jgi:DNA polymerase I
MRFYKLARLYTSTLELPGISIIKNKSEAIRTVELLYKYKDRVHAWDTETIGVNIKEESPVGKGYAICASAFAGPEVDFGCGPKLFVDNYGEASGVLDVFKEYFEDPSIYKVWHNYGFDRHILYNHGINVKGFGGDTMHMARLANPSRGPGEYSLSSCSDHYHTLMNKIKTKLISLLTAKYEKDPKVIESLKTYSKTSKLKVKKSIDELFAYHKTLKSGKESKLKTVPEVNELHTNPKYVESWINYATLDAVI